MNIILPKFKCWSPINLEGSWGGENIAKKAMSEFEFMNNGFEWVIDYGDDEDVEFVGVTFSGFPPEITDFDGVMSFPPPLIRWLDMNGFDTKEMFEDEDRVDDHIEYEFEFVLYYCERMHTYIDTTQISAGKTAHELRWKFINNVARPVL